MRAAVWVARKGGKKRAGKSTLSDTIASPWETASSPSVPALSNNHDIYAAMTKEESWHPCLNTNLLSGPLVGAWCWSNAVIPFHHVSSWHFSFFCPLLLLGAAPVVGLSDLKGWWSSDGSKWPNRYIFIMPQSAPQTLSLVFKPLYGKLLSRSWSDAHTNTH